MNRTKIMVVMLLVSGLVLGGCQTNKNNSVGGSTAAKSKTSLGSLLKGGISQECRYATVDGKNQTLIQVAGNKFYQEVKINEEKEETMYAVSDGEWMYSWNTMQPNQGVKFKMEELEEDGQGLAPTGETEQNQKVNLNNEVEVECKPWVVDNSKFAAPSNITFLDTSALIPKTTGGETNSQQMCQYCEMNPDAAAKAECKKSLGCE